MALQPVPAQHDVVIQDQSTGVVDFLKFNGTQLAGSFMKDYGIAGWKVVANGDFNRDGHPDLVVQSQTTGQLDFLFLDASANLIGTVLSNVPVPAVHGAGLFGFAVTGQLGPDLVSQLPNGELDFLVFDGNGRLVASDLVANTLGLPPMTGAAEGQSAFPIFGGIGGGEDDNVVVQNADGSIDVIGFVGSIGDELLTMSATFLLPGTAGSPAVVAVDQDVSLFDRDTNVAASANGALLETVEMVGATASGQIDHMLFDSGYNDAQHEGDEIGTLSENFTIPTGWQIVDGGIVAHADIFPLS